MTWIPLLSSLLLVLMAVGLRYRHVGWRHAAPLSLPPTVWAAGAALAALALIASLVRLRRAPPTTRQRRALLELLAVFLPLFLLVWGVLPSDGLKLRHAPLVAALLAGYGWLLSRRAAAPSPPVSHRARARQAGRRVAPATICILVACGVIAIATHTAPRPAAVAVSLATYPLFAALQLAVFAQLAIPRLSLLTARRWPVLVAAAGLFALAHWPNGFLMAACFAGMLLWADIWLRSPSLGVLALAMGVAATAVAQLLPPRLTQHLRTGPGFVLQAHREELMGRERALLGQLTSDAFYRDEGGTPEGLVAGVCARILRRAPSSAELVQWRAELEQARREAAVRSFCGSTEFLQRAAQTPGIPPPNEARVAQLASPEWLQAHGGDWPGFVQALYLELLGRSPSPSESAGWRPDPEVTERTHLVWMFLDSDEWASFEDEPAWAMRHLGPLLLR